MNIKALLKNYDMSNVTIGVLGSHSALDVCRGAKDEGLNTLVVAEMGREKPYKNYYKTRDNMGCVDETLVLNKFNKLLTSPIQKKLQEKNVIFVPHRSFEVYLGFDYASIEKKFNIPMFGNRHLLKIEERGVRFNQYDLLRKAGIRYPKIFNNPKDIDRLCLVKVLEKARGFERAFFIVDSFADYEEKVGFHIKNGSFTQKQLKAGVIEEFVIGVQVNFNFFYSPLSERLELIGTDTRRQTNLEGFARIPGFYHEELLKKTSIKYEEAGHIAVTVLESMLGDAFEMGERFVAATKKLLPPGVIGPFALQSIIVPGPPRKEIIVIDVSPRVPGSPGIASTPYSGYLFGKPVSVGKRIAMEINTAITTDRLNEILT